MKRTYPINFRADQSLLDQLKNLAEKESRTLTSMILYILRKYMAEQMIKQ
jgi:hypothetical protein